MQRVIDLDKLDPTEVILVTFGGGRVAITRSRLLDLLQREQDYWSLVSAPGAAEPPPQFEFNAQALPSESVSHASLSTRIKKVYTYSLASRKLRAAHVSLLTDLIHGFDWKIPKHPNTKLEVQLVEMLAFKDVPDEFRTLAMGFLERYLQSRRKAG